MASRPFRFGAQVGGAGSAKEWVDIAREAEALGYSSLMMPDHFGEQLAPMPALGAVAAATSTLRFGALVFDNDYRHPLMLAKEAATLDLLSDGRLELGIGAGWMRTDYEAAGMTYDEPKVRVDRFEEGLQVLKGLFADGPFSFSGRHYTVTEHEGTPKPVQRPHPPIIIGGGGRRVLSIAAREADIVGVNPKLTSGAVDSSIQGNTTPDATREKVAWVREAAGERFDQIELNILVGFAMLTDDRKAIAESMGATFGLSPDEAIRSVPITLVGTVDQMCEDLEWRRQEYGFSYVVFDGGSWRAMAPVVERLTGR
jgi:probable F420-dependent oxidoreductase